jgi:hypothetical protein
VRSPVGLARHVAVPLCNRQPSSVPGDHRPPSRAVQSHFRCGGHP